MHHIDSLLAARHCPCCPSCACQVRVLLSRPSHQAGAYSLRGNAVRAYTPHNPVPRDESWYFFLTEPSSNAVLAYAKVRSDGWP